MSENEQPPFPLPSRAEPEKPLQHLGAAMLPLVDKLAALRAKKRAAGTLPPVPPAPTGEWCPGCKMVHQCALCHDHGYVSVHRPEEPVHTTYELCGGPVCTAKRQEKYARALGATEIGEFGEAGFETFWARPWQRPAYDLALAFAQRTPPHGMLYLAGQNGTGKTKLAAAIAHAAVAAGYPALFFRTTTLLKNLRETFNPDAESNLSYSQLLSRVSEVRVLVLDDFGQERTTDWVQEVFFDLLDHRYVHARTMATVLTSNTKVSALASSLGSRLTDRQRSQVCLLLGTEDLRSNLTYRDHIVHDASWNMAAVPRAEHEVREGVVICAVCNCLPCHQHCPLGGEEADG